MAVSKKIMIITDTVQMGAELNDSKTAVLIWETLPLSAVASTWGDEIYFAIISSCNLTNFTTVNTAQAFYLR